MLKVVIDCICKQNNGDLEENKKEKRKGEDFWLEMFEKERVDKVVKKEVEEEKGKKNICQLFFRNDFSILLKYFLFALTVSVKKK